MEEKIPISKTHELYIKNLRLIDDDFMKIVFEKNNRLVEFILKLILNKNKLKVIELILQKEIKNVVQKSVILDIYVVDENNNYYNIEIQKQNIGASSKRARYNSSMLDTILLEKGMKTNSLSNSFVIFITEHDIFAKKQPIYKFERVNTETNDKLNDGSYIIYVNGEYRDPSTPIGKLMHDFHCKDPNEMYYEEIKKSVKYYKEAEEGRNNMCKIFEEIERKGQKQGRKQGQKQGRKQGLKQGQKQGQRISSIKSATMMIKLGKLTIEEIVLCSGLLLEEVQKIANQINNKNID